MDFVLSKHDAPQIEKHECLNKVAWKTCACDTDYIQPDHGVFLYDGMKSTGTRYKNFPIFGSATIPECYIDILLPAPYHILDKKNNDNGDPVPWE